MVKCMGRVRRSLCPLFDAHVRVPYYALTKVFSRALWRAPRRGPPAHTRLSTPRGTLLGRTLHGHFCMHLASHCCPAYPAWG